LIGHTNTIISLILFPDKSLMSLSADKTVKIWNSEDGSLVRSFPIYSKSITNALYLPDGTVATEINNGNGVFNVEIWI
jgi:WD40 repeat protein